MTVIPHGEEARSAVSNHEARGPSFETRRRRRSYEVLASSHSPAASGFTQENSGN